MCDRIAGRWRSERKTVVVCGVSLTHSYWIRRCFVEVLEGTWEIVKVESGTWLTAQGDASNIT
jgi:hypothetical protein